MLYPAVFKGKKILELGSGVGLSGIMIGGNINMATYTFTDYQASILKNIEDNITLNAQRLINSSCAYNVRLLDWAQETIPKELLDFDFIIGADLVSHVSIFLLNTL